MLKNLNLNSSKGIVKFSEVTFSYNEGEKVLKGLSFKINHGEKIAIVGSTGSGKTTIINLLNRFYEPQEGIISLDGVNISEIDIKSLRSNIALVLQDVFLFADTLLNNITLWNKDVPFKAVTDAAKKIGIHDFIMSLPNGYNYNVRERGVMMSQGQRQLIAFLRAYIKHPSILILDEATSSIDSKSEKLIQNATETITKNKTSIIIAHRLSTILKSDRIIVLNDGVIIEQGKHEELITIENGIYKNLYEDQLRKTKIKQAQPQS